MRPSTKQVTAALAAVALAFTALRACSGDDDADRPTTPVPVIADPGDRPVGPTRVDHDVPMGWRHDAAGARAAAMSAVGTTGPIARAGFITRRDMIDQLATTDYADTLASTSARQLDDLMGDLGAAGPPRLGARGVADHDADRLALGEEGVGDDRAGVSGDSEDGVHGSS